MTGGHISMRSQFLRGHITSRGESYYYDRIRINDRVVFNDILHMSFLAGTHVFKAFPAYTTTEL